MPTADTAMMRKSQEKFLLGGGIFEMPLEMLYDKGIFVRPSEYVHQEYPKWVERGDVSLIVKSRDEERRLTVALEKAEQLDVRIPDEPTLEALEHHIAIAEELAGKRIAARDPKAVALARMQRLRAEMEVLEAEIGDEEDVGSLAPSPPPVVAKPSRRPLPVVASED